MAVVPDHGVLLLVADVPRFVDLTSHRACSDTDDVYPIAHLDTDAEEPLRELLAGIMRRLAGSDWTATDPGFAHACAEAEIDFDELLRIRPSQTPGQQADRKRKELGDLGEILAVLCALGYEDADPLQLLPKNVFKLYELLSEPGIDVLVFDMDLESTEETHLLDGERVRLIESKASEAESFATLAREAAASHNRLDLPRWQSELRLAAASFRQRGAPAVAQRLKHFLLELRSRSVRLSLDSFLASSTGAEEPHPLPDLAAIAERQPAAVCLARFDVDALRLEAFAFRDGGAPS